MLEISVGKSRVFGEVRQDLCVPEHARNRTSLVTTKCARWQLFWFLWMKKVQFQKYRVCQRKDSFHLGAKLNFAQHLDGLGFKAWNRTRPPASNRKCLSLALISMSSITNQLPLSRDFSPGFSKKSSAKTAVAAVENIFTLKEAECPKLWPEHCFASVSS